MHPCSDLVICALLQRWRPCGVVMYRDLRTQIARYVVDPYARMCCWVALFRGAAPHGSVFPLATTWHRIMSRARVNKKCVKFCHLPALVRAGGGVALDELMQRIEHGNHMLTLVYEIVRAKSPLLAYKYRQICYVDIEGWTQADVDIIQPTMRNGLGTGLYYHGNIIYNPAHVKQLSTRLGQPNTDSSALVCAINWFRSNPLMRGKMLLQELLHPTNLYHLMTQSDVDVWVCTRWLVTVPVDEIDRVMVSLYTARVRFIYN